MITKNKGADGKYYKMFMDDSLQIRPSDLDDTMDNQLICSRWSMRISMGDDERADQHLHPAGECDEGRDG